MKKILVAGIGNIFHGDDAFGCEVVRRADPNTLGNDVEVVDFGIRGYDLACAMTSGYETIILIDAVSRGGDPGTLYLIEPSVEAPREPGEDAIAVDPHGLNPVAVIRLAQSLGGVKGKLYLIGCEPEILEPESGEMELSEKVRASVPDALRMLEGLVEECLGKKLA